MKSALLITVISSFFFTACDDNISESKIPSVVVNSVKSNYSSEKIEWEKSATGYEAEFKKGKLETKVLVDSIGKILMQKQELKPVDLPGEITQAITASYKDYTIEEADRLEKDGVVNYQVELDGKGSNKNLELVYTAEGKPGNLNYWK